jgi:putative transposase
MANTYTQIYIHAVFSPLRREAMILPPWKERIHQYITGIVRQKGHKVIVINSMPDHLHLFMGTKPDEALSDLIRDVKRDSTNFINRELVTRGRFAWQEGFGAFSCSHSQIGTVAEYVRCQEEHHRRVSFREEYLALLREYAVEHDAKYLFQWIGAEELNP